jgi:phosphoserine phosphatase
MDYRLVLTAALGKLHDDAVSRIADIVGHLPHWLSPGTACEFAVADPKTTAKVRAALAGFAVDANTVPVAARRKKMLLADMDSTIIACECLDEIADFAGMKPKIAAITERAMLGDIEFEPALRERVALLEGLPATTLEKVYERIELNPGARALASTMSEAGALTVLISGGFSYFTERIAKVAGFRANQANELLIAGGKLSGGVAEPVLGRVAKQEALHRLAKLHAIALSDTLAVGDGANDLGMIADAGLGVAYHAKPIVAAAAGACLDHSDLEAVLFLQGYRDDEIVRD